MKEHSSTSRIRLIQSRRGVATLWVVVAVPVILTMLVLVSDIANLRLARIEAENALEAAALAGVEQWNQGGNSAANRTASRQAALSYSAANRVLDQPVLIDANEDQTSGDVNDNASPTGNVLLGSITQNGGQLLFDSSTAPNPGEFGVHVQATVPVQSLWGSFGGSSFGPYSVTIQVTAWVDSGNEPKLIRIDSFLP